MRNSIAEKLRGLIRGRVIEDDAALRPFGRDQSMYEIKPLLAVLPEDLEDVLAVVRFARAEGIRITPRGGGSGTAGGALGHGLVLALPRNDFWSRIDCFSSDRVRARVFSAAGVYHADLQKFLNERGFFLPADVTSASISRIGGNIATRASGPHALRYGSIDRFLDSVEFVTAQGALINTADEKSIPALMKNRLDELGQRIRQNEASRRILESRKGLKTASGYNLSVFLGGLSTGQIITKLLAGSVGTLGYITGANLLAEVTEHGRAALVLSFYDLSEAARAVAMLRVMNVAAIEMVSKETIRIIREQIRLSETRIDRFAVDAHLLVVEVTGPDLPEILERMRSMLNKSGLRMIAPPLPALEEEDLQALWNLRKQILWLIEHPKPGLLALAVVNDVGVPPDRLADFVADAEKIFHAHGLAAPIYGHAGNGNLHLRPLFDVSLPDLPGRVRRLAEDVYESVLRLGGTITAEHGMGRLRAPYLKQEWGEALYGSMKEIKEIFDPDDLFNPGAMFSESPITENMRPDLFEKIQS